MFTQSLWLILTFVCTISNMTACDSAVNAPPPLSIEAHTAQERAIYETVLQIPADSNFVVRDHTLSLFEPNMMGNDTDAYMEMLRGSLPTLQAETWNHLLSVGGEEIAFPSDLETGGPYQLITDEAWAGYFGGIDSTAWERFEADYGAQGFATYSRVGFNRDTTQALLYRGVVCGVLCGNGGYVLLEKVDGVWQIVGEYEVWMS
jgi:hypothetical protein